MATLTVTCTPTFPEGTSVACHPRSQWRGDDLSGAPSGAATDTQTVLNGSATFTGLSYDTVYILTATVNSTRRFMRIIVPHATTTTTPPASRNTIAVIGASTEQNWGDPVSRTSARTLSANNDAVTSQQIGSQLTYWLNGRADIVYNGGVSGETSAQILARTDAAIAAAGPDVGFWVIGCVYGNDTSTVSTATSIAQTNAIYDKFQSHKAIKVLCTWTNNDAGMNGTLAKPGGGFYSQSEWIERVRAQNQAIRDYAASHDGYVVADLHSEVTRSGLWRSGYSNDGLHPNHLGGDHIARILANVISPDLVNDSRLADTADATCVFGSDHFLTGTAVSGVAANWSTTSVTNCTPTVESRTDGYGNWQVFTMTGAGGTVTFFHAFTTELTQGTKFYAEAEIRVDGDWTNPLACELYINPQAPANVTSAAQLTTNITPAPKSMNPGASVGVLRTPTATAGVSFTSGYLIFTFKADSPSVIRVGRIGIRKVL